LASELVAGAVLAGAADCAKAAVAKRPAIRVAISVFISFLIG
jgi:hypothetical protein